MLFSPLRRATRLLLLLALAAACNKNDQNELEGAAPVADFTFALNTSQYPVVVTFTNTTTDGFLYQWDFGDGSPLATGKNVTHTYTLPRTYEVRLVVAGRGGTGNAPVREVTIPSICSNAKFAGLTACGTAFWTYSELPGAIKYFGPDGITVDSVARSPLSECQGDDVFTFGSNFSYVYDAGVNCTPNRNLSGLSDFTFREINGQSLITLRRNGAFVGRPDSVQNKTYEIIEATPTLLRLQGTLPSGHKVEVTLVPPLPPLVRAERLLTGGSSRTWVLDNTANAPIVVGTEANPAEYFVGVLAGGLPPCQADDEYTFTTGRSFRYDARAETFSGGPPEPVRYACLAPRSLTTPFTFGPASAGGVAQITLNNATAFVGATDSGLNGVYRILSINSRNMVLRGTGRDPAAPQVRFTLKLRVR